MQSLSLSYPLTSPAGFSTKSTPLLSLPPLRFSKPITPHLSLSSSSSSHHFNPLRLSLNQQKLMGSERRLQRSGIVCYSSSSLLSPGYLHWAAAVSAAILMLVKGAGINKAYVVPLFALQAPPSIISWMKGQYGAWSAFLALLIRLFFFLPGELELPFIALVMVIVAPSQAMNLRGTQGGTIISLVIAAYLAFQHFSGAGTLRKAFDRNSIVATLAIVCLTVVPILLLIWFQLMPINSIKSSMSR